MDRYQDGIQEGRDAAWRRGVTVEHREGLSVAVRREHIAEILAMVEPHPEELRWLSIPWQTDLWEARRLALQSGKPLFLWAMNGNPLGCT
ncbi:MAG: hypothetical protein M1396_02275 [Chloroflexi bacterium]|nr:hypothetical protein [Chloroflexota bacterium]